MIAALLYLQFHTIVNRQKQRLKRLKKPKYLIGAVVGALYFYLYFYRFVFGFGRARASTFQISSGHLQVAEAVGAAVLLGIVLLAWIIPHGRAALAFTDAEVNFLFPAPISRRVLIHYKLLRSQVAILFTTLLLTLISGRFRIGGPVWIHALGWWIILSTLNLHFLGSSFARTMLLDRGVSNWKRRLAIALLLIGFAAVVIVWGRRTLHIDKLDFENAVAMKSFFREIAVAGPVPYLLYPFRLVVRPYLAADASGFLLVLGPAVLLLLLHYVWVVRSNVAFEEASIDFSRRLAERISAARSGQARLRPLKARRSPFHLAPVGSPTIGLLWKNLVSAGQFFTVRIWILLALSVLPSLLITSASLGRGQFSSYIGIGALMIIIWSVLIGPQVLRHDFRQDLPVVDILKTYPLRGWEVVLGELLAPAAILSSIQWLLILIAVLCVGHLPGAFGFAWRATAGFGAAVVLPGLNLLCLIIPNASALLYPGWFQTGRDGPQGIEATGQRLFMMLGQVVALTLALLPGIGIFAVVCLILGRVFGQWLLAILLGSVAASASLLIETGIAVVLLGKVFERFDQSAES